MLFFTAHMTSLNSWRVPFEIRALTVHFLGTILNAILNEMIAFTAAGATARARWAIPSLLNHPSPFFSTLSLPPRRVFLILCQIHSFLFLFKQFLICSFTCLSIGSCTFTKYNSSAITSGIHNGVLFVSFWSAESCLRPLEVSTECLQESFV